MHAGDVPISLTECARVLVDICYGGQSCSASHTRTVNTLLTDAVSRTATERVEELRLTGPVTACMQRRWDQKGNQIIIKWVTLTKGQVDDDVM